MKIRGDIERVNLASGERYQRVSGDGESRLEKVAGPEGKQELGAGGTEMSETSNVVTNPVPIVDIQGETIIERHLREELRIANAHLVAARRQLRELTLPAAPEAPVGEAPQTCQECGKPMFFHGDTWYHVNGADVMNCPATQIQEEEQYRNPAAIIKNLSMLVRRLCHRLNKHEPKSAIVTQSLNYLRGEGLQGSVLRDEVAASSSRSTPQASTEWMLPTAEELFDTPHKAQSGDTYAQFRDRCIAQYLSILRKYAPQAAAVSDKDANPVIDWDRLKCYGCGEKATRIHKSFVVPICASYPSCKASRSRKSGE